jgi:hypothetical protein
MAGASLITASTFVRQNTVWTQVAPYMDSVTRFANTSQISLGTAVPRLGDNQRNATIADAAFLVAGSDFSGDSYSKKTLGHYAKDSFLRLPKNPNPAMQAGFSSDEWEEIGLLARGTQRYTSALPRAIFSPSIPGCGVVDAGIGDVLAGSEIVEIKAVTRPFRAYDLRQALTYAAMLYSSNYLIDYITLLNPRRARFVKLPIGQIAAGIRGDSAVELLQDLVESMMGLQVSA